VLIEQNTNFQIVLSHHGADPDPEIGPTFPGKNP